MYDSTSFMLQRVSLFVTAAAEAAAVAVFLSFRYFSFRLFVNKISVCACAGGPASLPQYVRALL